MFGRLSEREQFRLLLLFRGVADQLNQFADCQSSTSSFSVRWDFAGMAVSRVPAEMIGNALLLALKGFEEMMIDGRYIVKENFDDFLAYAVKSDSSAKALMLENAYPERELHDRHTEAQFILYGMKFTYTNDDILPRLKVDKC